jgi:hypothetical protein
LKNGQNLKLGVPNGLAIKQQSGNTGLGTLPLSLPQSIIDRQNREFIRGNPPILKLHAGRQLLQNGASIDMHEGKDTANSSIPF